MSQSPSPGGWPDPTTPTSGGWPDLTPPTAPPENNPQHPVYPGMSYGTPAAAPPGYGYGYPQYGYPPAPKTNSMAVASMVISIIGAAGLCAYGVGGLLGIVGAILGHVARRQIRDRGEAGDGMALAGIIVGWVALGIGILTIGALIVVFMIAWNLEGTVS